MIAALARAGAALSVPRYIEAAERAGRLFLEANEDATLPRAIVAGEPALHAGLSDYAALGLGYLALFDVTGERAWIEAAEKLASTITDRFADTATGDYFMTASADGFGRIRQHSDNALPAASALTLRFLVRLDRRSLDPQRSSRIAALTAALSGHAVKGPIDHAATLAVISEARFGERGTHQSFGHGAVRVAITRSAGGRELNIVLDHKSGWHVNSNAPLDDDVVATGITLSADQKPVNASIVYPEPVLRELGFADAPLAVFEGKNQISVKLPEDMSGGALEVELTLQPCSDEICLEPETGKFIVGR